MTSAMRVSVECLCKDATCKHRRPLHEVFAGVTRMSEAGSTVRHSPPLSGSSSDEGIMSASIGIAAKFAQVTSCTSCFIFTALGPENCCVNGNECASPLHLYDAWSEEQSVRGISLCHHSKEEPCRRAHMDGLVCIKNHLFRTPQRKGHVQVQHAMAIPLVIAGLGEVERIGVMLLANPTRPFAVQDYARIHIMVGQLACGVYQSFCKSALRVGKKALDEAHRMHVQEMTRLSRTRDSFIATMSHEIRTPLNAVNGYNELMARKTSDEDVLRGLRKQRDAILQLTNLIANILDFSKLKSDSLKLESRPFHVRECIERAIGICGIEAVTKNITLTCSIDESIPQTLMGDSTRVYQVLMNLLSNAVKFTPAGGFVAFRTTCARDDADPDMHQLRFEVIDTGRGIPANMRARIFDEFQQMRNTISSPVVSVQGVGLGLAICRELVKLMHGTITVESDGQTGSTFIFTATFRDASSVGNLLRRAKEMMGPAPVLIVDDKEINRVTLLKQFVDWGFTPHACSSIDEALHTLESFPPSYYKLALIDIDIAGESGLTLAREIARRSEFSHMFTVAISSMGRDFGGADEFDSVHEKPVHPDVLLADIVRLSQFGSTRRTSDHPATTTTTMTRPSNPPQTVARKPITVLVVDDDAPSLSVMSDVVRELFPTDTVLQASSGASALRVLHDTAVDCVFMDLVMPEMDGIECIRTICNDSNAYGTPKVVALTADAVEETRARAMAAGASEFLSKPASMEDIEAVLASCVVAKRSSALLGTPKKRRKKKKRRAPALETKKSSKLSTEQEE